MAARRPGWWAVLVALWLASLVCVVIYTTEFFRDYNARRKYAEFDWWICRLGVVTNVSGTVHAPIFNGVLMQREFGQRRNATLFPNETSPVRLLTRQDARCYTDHNFTAAYLTVNKPPGFSLEEVVVLTLSTSMALITTGGLLWLRIIHRPAAATPKSDPAAKSSIV